MSAGNGVSTQASELCLHPELRAARCRFSLEAQKADRGVRPYTPRPHGERHAAVLQKSAGGAGAAETRSGHLCWELDLGWRVGRTGLWRLRTENPGRSGGGGCRLRPCLFPVLPGCSAPQHSWSPCLPAVKSLPLAWGRGSVGHFQKCSLWIGWMGVCHPSVWCICGSPSKGRHHLKAVGFLRERNSMGTPRPLDVGWA